MAVTQSAKQRVPAALLSAVAFIIGFVPWIIYWILVGNAPFLTAVLAGLGFAVAINVSTLVRRQPLMVLEAGTAVVFAVFVIMALTLPEVGVAMLVTSKYPDWFVEASGGEAAPEVAGSPDTLDIPVDDASGPTVHLNPAAVLADETAAVRITGVAPAATVSLSAETIDAFGHRWRSTTTATADAKGMLEVADPDALIWSMNFASPEATPDIFIPPAEPAMTLVLAEAAGKRSHATLVRSASTPDIDVQEVRAPGVVGRLFLPPGTASVPGVVLFPGSEGGLDSQTSNAELLASHGCVSLVAATFAGDGPPVAGLPPRLERVPLERFADAIRWLASHDRVDASHVSAMAISRGSEGLLATASRTDDLPLRSIVAVSPSSATWVDELYWHAA